MVGVGLGEVLEGGDGLVFGIRGGIGGPDDAGEVSIEEGIRVGGVGAEQGLEEVEGAEGGRGLVGGLGLPGEEFLYGGERGGVWGEGEGIDDLGGGVLACLAAMGAFGPTEALSALAARVYAAAMLALQAARLVADRVRMRTHVGL